MPSLDFNGVFQFDHQMHLFQPHEMFWSAAEFHKQANYDWMITEQEKRAVEKMDEVNKEAVMVKNAYLKVFADENNQ